MPAVKGRGGVYPPPFANADSPPPSAEGGKGVPRLRARGGGFPIAPSTPSGRSLLSLNVAMALSGEMQAYCDIEDDMVKGMFGTIVQGYLKKGDNRATAEMMAREFFSYES